jgi:hypothetical protein
MIFDRCFLVRQAVVVAVKVVYRSVASEPDESKKINSLTMALLSD